MIYMIRVIIMIIVSPFRLGGISLTESSYSQSLSENPAGGGEGPLLIENHGVVNRL